MNKKHALVVSAYNAAIAIERDGGHFGHWSEEGKPRYEELKGIFEFYHSNRRVYWRKLGSLTENDLREFLDHINVWSEEAGQYVPWVDYHRSSARELGGWGIRPGWKYFTTRYTPYLGSETLPTEYVYD